MPRIEMIQGIGGGRTIRMKDPASGIVIEKALNPSKGIRSQFQEIAEELDRVVAIERRLMEQRGRTTAENCY